MFYVATLYMPNGDTVIYDRLTLRKANDKVDRHFKEAYPNAQGITLRHEKRTTSFFDSKYIMDDDPPIVATIELVLTTTGERRVVEKYRELLAERRELDRQIATLTAAHKNWLAMFNEED